MINAHRGGSIRPSLSADGLPRRTVYILHPGFRLREPPLTPLAHGRMIKVSGRLTARLSQPQSMIHVVEDLSTRQPT